MKMWQLSSLSSGADDWFSNQYHTHMLRLLICWQVECVILCVRRPMESVTAGAADQRCARNVMAYFFHSSDNICYLTYCHDDANNYMQNTCLPDDIASAESLSPFSQLFQTSLF